jgi:hypothetical protein
VTWWQIGVLCWLSFMFGFWAAALMSANGRDRGE